MSMRRRDFLKTGTAISLAGAAPRFAWAETSDFTPTPGAWRQFQTVTRVEIPAGPGAVQAWLPVPSVDEPDWFRPISTDWKTETGKAVLTRDTKSKVPLLHVEWADRSVPAVIEVTSRFATRDRAIDLSGPGKAAALADEARRH
jgi:hypothetical protein